MKFISCSLMPARSIVNPYVGFAKTDFNSSFVFFLSAWDFFLSAYVAFSGMAGSQVQMGPGGIWRSDRALRPVGAHLATRHCPLQQVMLQALLVLLMILPVECGIMPLFSPFMITYINTYLHFSQLHNCSICVLTTRRQSLCP